MISKLNSIPVCLLIYIVLNYTIPAFGKYSATISGFVLDAKEGHALEAANVYVSNTTFGDATNSQGKYVIPSVPPGLHELVVSIVGYEVQTKLIRVEKHEDLNISFKLKPKIYKTDAIKVVAEDQKDWFRDLNNFKKLFLGSSPFSKNCTIKNDIVLDFSWPIPTRMKASASEPLIIINKSLGFKISCLLLDFTWDKVQQKWGWMIKPHYQELEPESFEQKKLWEENRTKAHLGSLRHFLTSLRNIKLEQSGYAIFFSKRTSNMVSPLEQYPAVAESLYTEALTPDEKIVTFDDFLKVVYLHEFTPDRSGYQTSWLRLTQEKVTLDRHGYPLEYQPFEVYGYWASLGVADLLPRYYFVDTP